MKGGAQLHAELERGVPHKQDIEQIEFLMSQDFFFLHAATHSLMSLVEAARISTEVWKIVYDRNVFIVCRPLASRNAL